MRLFYYLVICWLPLTVYLSGINSCYKKKEKLSGNQNFSRLYKKEQIGLHPKYVVYHRTNTTSELYFKINTKELLYNKQTDSPDFIARLSVHYRLISTYETKEIIDSATVILSDVYASAPKDIIGKVDISATLTNSYILQVQCTDLNRNITSSEFITVDKQTANTRQNFLVLSVVDKAPIFRDYIGEKEKFSIRYRTRGTLMYVRYYHRDFPPPAPPFATGDVPPFEYRADSLFTIEPDGKDSLLVFGKQGFYHIQTDTSTGDGLTLYRFNNDFPLIKTPQEMFLPLRYLTSKQEYTAMANRRDLKTAVDSFWVTAGGGMDRGRELIRKYYNRVQDANNYFTSFAEGWNTDRGLIYIIYGPPAIVYKSSESETWVYGEESNFNSLSLTFLRVINPFSDNDYRLQRSSLYNTGWYNAVDIWRQGRVYSEK